jgi:acid phosphatase family membrane protein YuiD
VVLYDASGVRRAAGLTAARVNGLSAAEAAPEAKPLKENLGHTRLEVLVGSLIGPAVALPGLVLVGSPWQLAIGWGLVQPLS